ncbi:MucR family transcriptional regulator [Henriciella litoralis]|uniref:MucR family transcriptional regulator n=1 Tax=Henriciella litoralis TaxID=568102 RepID=UPI0009FCD16A|nr:MucR family transcriptional regulator [Henriciella litoralis]
MRDKYIQYTTEIVSAYVANNSLSVASLPSLIETVHEAICSLSGVNTTEQEEKLPAVSPAKSITADYLICLEDGKELKMLKRYLQNHYGLTPDAYRAKWNLPADYPMVAPNYAKRRSEFAKKIGLGKKRTD